MSQDETDSIISKANDCVEGECSLDEVDELIGVLKDQQKELYDRVEDIRSMVKSLETVNSQDDREVDQIRETVRAIFRVFQLGDKARYVLEPSGIFFFDTFKKSELTNFCICSLELFFLFSGNDYPALSKPTGWTGDVGSGPTTAYDALPPKPFKKTP